MSTALSSSRRKSRIGFSTLRSGRSMARTARAPNCSKAGCWRRSMRRTGFCSAAPSRRAWQRAGRRPEQAIEFALADIVTFAGAGLEPLAVEDGDLATVVVDQLQPL